MTETPLSLTPLRLIFDEIPICVIAIDIDYRIIICNKTCEAFLGLNSLEALGTDFREVYRKFNLADKDRFLSQAIDNGTVTMSKTATFVINGINADIEVSATPLLDGNNNIIGAIGVFQVARQLQATEQRMRHLETLAAIGQVAAGTVHEIRNPLTTIKGFTQLIQSRVQKQNWTAVTEYCSFICDEIDHINSIVSNFLTLSRPQNLVFTTLDVVQLVRDIVVFMYGESLIHGITLVYTPPGQAIYINGNMAKLKEVLINLCRNAFQAMAAGGTVSFAVTSYTDTVTISITDTGCGMTPDTMANLFKPFFTTKEAGTGLGLSICQQIVREHNGEIKVASELGIGSTFTLVLPRHIT